MMHGGFLEGSNQSFKMKGDGQILSVGMMLMVEPISSALLIAYINCSEEEYCTRNCTNEQLDFRGGTTCHNCKYPLTPILPLPLPNLRQWLIS